MLNKIDFRETEDYQPGLNRPHHIQAKITDWKQFKEFVQRHGDKTQAEMSSLWHEPISNAKGKAT